MEQIWLTRLIPEFSVYITERFDGPESAGEGAFLALKQYQSLIAPEKMRIKISDLSLHRECDWEKWIGLENSEGQNFGW